MVTERKPSIYDRQEALLAEQTARLNEINQKLGCIGVFVILATALLAGILRSVWF